MANRFQKGLGMAATGAAIGSAIPIVGTGLGAGLGFLGGLFSGNDASPDYPEWSMDPNAIRSLNYSDIDLQSMNPEMYQEILRNKMMIDEAQRILSQRREGMTGVERARLREDETAASNRMGQAGLAGTPIGESIMANVRTQGRNAAEERAFNEYLGLYQNAANAVQNGAQLTRQAYGDVMNNMMANRQNSMQAEAMRQNYDLGKYNAAAGEAAANNQFYSGLFNGGMSFLGNTMNANAMSKRFGGNSPYDMPWAPSWLSGGGK